MFCIAMTPNPHNTHTHVQLYDSQSAIVQATIHAGDAMMLTADGDHYKHSYELLFAAIGSFLAWTDSYFILHTFNRHCSAEWNCRLITVLHAVVATSLCFTSAVLTGPWPFNYIGGSNTSLHNTIMVISLGYFLFDFVWCIRMKTEGAVMLAHHVVSILGLAYCLYQGKTGSELTAVLGASEVSNPLLQLRWFLRERGYYKGKVAFILDFLFVSAFWTARLGVGSVFHFVCQTSPKLDVVIKGGGQAFYIISVIFGIQIAVYFYKKYIRKRR